MNPDKKRIIAALVAELLGSMFLIFIGIGIQANEEYHQSKISDANSDLRKSSSFVISLALGSGMTYAGVSAAFGRLSGAHFNPAITVAAIVGKRIPLALGLLYILVQMIGAVIGSAMFDGLAGESNIADLGVVRVATEFDTGRIFGLELVSTSFVVYVWHSLNGARRSLPHVQFRSETGPFFMGLAYFVASMLTYRWDGVGLNPIRAFGPSLVAGDWKHWWVYWLGPLMGGMAGVLLFELLAFLSPPKHDSAKVQPAL